jgi:hypothetical protein
MNSTPTLATRILDCPYALRETILVAVGVVALNAVAGLYKGELTSADAQAKVSAEVRAAVANIKPASQDSPTRVPSLLEPGLRFTVNYAADDDEKEGPGDSGDRLPLVVENLVALPHRRSEVLDALLDYGDQQGRSEDNFSVAPANSRDTSSL